MTTTLPANTLYRPADSRGKTRIDWLESYHSFSFGDYYDPRFMGFSDLRVINDDYVAPEGGFATHGHRDMEIITVVLDGELAHKDSLGNGSLILPGEVQRMSAGSGIRHSEFNPSTVQPVHLLQIWILPEKQGIEPSYEQTRFEEDESQNRFRLVASRDGREGSVTIHQDAELYLANISQNNQVEMPLLPERSYWVHVATGQVASDGVTLSAGDSLGITTGTSPLVLTGKAEATSTVLLFSLRPVND
jgi:redox-sensitive bicupin YhaK (pirin superfamily)